MKFLSLFICVCLLLVVAAAENPKTRRANKGNTVRSVELENNVQRQLKGKSKNGKGKANKMSSSKEGKGKGTKDSKKSSKKSSKRMGKGGKGDVSMSPSSMPSAMPSKTPIAISSVDMSNDAISADDEGPISHDAISVDEGPISYDAISADDEGPINNDAISMDDGNRDGTDAPDIIPIPLSKVPTASPTKVASKQPVTRLTEQPSASPTAGQRSGPDGPSIPDIPVLTAAPSPEPTDVPIARLTTDPTKSPTRRPTGSPTKGPTKTPTMPPTGAPTKTPSSPAPTESPTKGPTKKPTGTPTKSPTQIPTYDMPPTKAPSSPSPSAGPTKGPTKIPTTASPTAGPTKAPSSPRVGDGDQSGVEIPLISILRGRLEPNSYYGGSEFEDTNSYQYKALQRVEEQDGIELMGDKELIQYYVLYCIFLSTGGAGWVETEGWMRNDLNPCGGFFGVSCDEENLIVGINMYENGLSGTFPPEITLLASDGYRSTGAGYLRSLDLYLNPNLGNGNDSHWVSELGRALKYLFLGNTGFGGSIPRLPLGLIEFDASYTNINGGLVASNFNGLNHLTWLLLDGCSFQTSIPTEFAQLPKLEYFYISDADITGDLSYLEGMPVLFEHFASNNPGLGGELYSFIGDIDTLASLNLGGNSLEGTIPNSIGNLANLQQLWLNDNNLTGSIPDQMSRLISLKTLELEGNNFVGNFPPNICELKEDGYGYLEKLGADCSALRCECCDCCTTELCAAL